MTSLPTDPSFGLADPAIAKAQPAQRKITLAWSAIQPDAASITVAFASRDRLHVDQHFGAAEGFVLYAVDHQRAHLAGILEFAPESMDGNENKLAEKIHALQGCAAVYCLAVGGSAVRQLLAKGIQPIRLEQASAIDSLLGAVRQAMHDGGVSWIDRRLQRDADAERFERMADEGWQE